MHNLCDYLTYQCVFFFSNNVRFYNPTCPKRFESFKDLYNRSGLVGSYNFDNPKRPWFLVIIFNLTESLVGPN